MGEVGEVGMMVGGGEGGGVHKGRYGDECSPIPHPPVLILPSSRICEMSLAHCQEVLDAHMNHSNWKKVVHIGM